MSAAWLTPPVQLHSSRMFGCEGFTDEQCNYYRYPWRFWYEADHVYALPTIAFFMCTIGMFIISHLITQLLGYRSGRRYPPLWRRLLAGLRYLSYRGFHIPRLGWNSAPIGVLLLGFIGATFFICMDLIPQPYYWPSLDWGSSPPLGTRSGWMALACMPFVFATASKTNWITLLTGVTHEKIQVFHRWTGYAFFMLALLHTFPFVVFHIRHHDMVMQVEMGLIFYWTGIVALMFQTWLTLASFGPLRNLGYEFFRTSHFLSVIVFVLVLFWHCDYTLSSWDYFIATAAVYVPCLVYPWLRTAFQYGFHQKAEVIVEDNGFTQITIPANFDWVPGQHCFLRFHGFGIHALTSHPFTICSLPSVSPNEQSHTTFYIRHRSGLTARLHDYAVQHPGVAVPVLVDGPYGGIDTQKFYGSNRIVVIAGGSGAGWSLSFIEQYVRCRCSEPKISSSDSSEADSDENLGNDHKGAKMQKYASAPQSLRVILATRDTVTQVWFHKAVSELLSRYPESRSMADLTVEVFLTGKAKQPQQVERSLAELRCARLPSSLGEKIEVQQSRKNSVAGLELYGRPQLPQILHEEAVMMAETERSLGVFACGPLTMQNDIRNAVAKENLDILGDPRSVGVYLHLEHFSWA